MRWIEWQLHQMTLLAIAQNWMECIAREQEHVVELDLLCKCMITSGDSSEAQGIDLRPTTTRMGRGSNASINLGSKDRTGRGSRGSTWGRDSKERIFSPLWSYCFWWSCSMLCSFLDFIFYHFVVQHLNLAHNLLKSFFKNIGGV